MISKKIILGVIFLICTNCKSPKIIFQTDSITEGYSKKSKISDTEIKNWQHKDIISDTIPGISLNKAYSELIKNSKGDQVIVAVLDTGFDIDHKELENCIWTNTDEITIYLMMLNLSRGLFNPLKIPSKKFQWLDLCVCQEVSLFHFHEF